MDNIHDQIAVAAGSNDAGWNLRYIAAVQRFGFRLAPPAGANYVPADLEIIAPLPVEGPGAWPTGTRVVPT